MANEFKHDSVGTQLTQAEWEAVGGHVFDSQATGDIVYASSTSQLSRLGIGSTGAVLTVTGGIPAWDTTWTPTGHLIPATDDSYDLGSSSAAWQDLFLEGDITLTDAGTIATSAGALTITSAAAATWSTSAGALTITSAAALNLNPTAGSAIVLDSTINVDAGVVTGATSITSTAFVGTLSTAAQTNITSLGTLTALTVDDVAIDGKVVTMTGSASDTAVFTAGTNGTLSIVTTDAAAAAANIQITADGTVDIDSAGVLTLDSGAAINIEPASGSAILLDGTISIDAGVVTGATSITSTAFVGDITGDVTGNTDTFTASANNSTNETVYPVFVDGATGTQGAETDTGLTYNPSSGVLTATQFTGALTGAVTGNADTATLATTVTITDNESTNESNAIIFTAGGDVDGGNLGLESDGTLTYNPSTGKITATGFIGTLTGTADTATVATTVTITDNESTNEDNAIIFTAGGDVDGGNIGLESDGTMTYNPSTGKITATGFIGALTGNADTATALASGRTIAMTGYVAWTSASFDGSGNVTGAGTIQADAVETGMLNDNVISGQTEITSGLAAADELLYSDGGTLKKVGVDTLTSYLAGVNAGTVTSTGISDSSGVLTLDIQNMTAETTVADADLVVIDDGAGGTLRGMTRANFIESAALDAINIDGGAIDGAVIGANSAAAITGTTITANTSIIPDAVGGADIGSTSAEWGDVFIADDKAIKFGNDQNATIEYDENGTDQLRIGGTGVVIENSVEIADNKFIEFASTAGTPASNDGVQGIVIEFLAAEALTQWDAVYASTTTGRVGRADANDAAKMPVIGVAIEGQGSAGSSVRVLTHGVFRDDGGFGGNLTPGNDVFAPETPGTLQAAIPADADDFVQVVGVAIGVRTAFINPDLTIIERAA